MSEMTNIPKVDLSDFISDDKSKKQKFVDKIGQAYEEIGFVSLKNHFLDDELMAHLYKEVKAFFDLSEETKRQSEIKELGGQRGYTSSGKEHAKGREEGDLKEFWHFGQEPDEEANLPEKYPENVTANELDDFNKVGMEAYRMLEK